MIIRRYNKLKDENNLMTMLKKEGSAWACYWDGKAAEKYEAALVNSITHVACENYKLLGYSRAIADFEFCIYICDLLVDSQYRGNGIGSQLMKHVLEEYSNYKVYVFSVADGYYKKLGYEQKGSIFIVQ